MKNLLTRMKAKMLGSKLWGRKWYQTVNLGEGISTHDLAGGGIDRATLRTESFQKWVTKVVKPADSIVDVGCNAGLFTLEAAQICNRAVGVEYDKDFVNQAAFLKRAWDKQGKSVGNVEFIHGSIADHLAVIQEATVLFASKVLYHKNLGEDLFRLMEAVQASKIDRILAQGHVTQGTLGSIAGMTQLFKDYGFSTEVLEEIDEYPILLATRQA